MGHAPPAGGPSTSVRTQDHACSLVCPTLRGPLPLLGNGLGLGHGHGHEHGWLAGWLGSYPAAVSRAPTTPRRSGAKKKVQCINPFLPVVLSRKGNPPPPPCPPNKVAAAFVVPEHRCVRVTTHHSTFTPRGAECVCGLVSSCMSDERARHAHGWRSVQSHDEGGPQLLLEDASKHRQMARTRGPYLVLSPAFRKETGVHPKTVFHVPWRRLPTRLSQASPGQTGNTLITTYWLHQPLPVCRTPRQLVSNSIVHQT